MMYIDFQAGNKEYKLRLNTRATVTLEKTLGCNPLMIFGKGERIPTITEMVTILHAALQPYQHNISMEVAYDIFDTYLEEHSATDFISVIVDVFKASGIIREGQEQEGKN